MENPQANSADQHNDSPPDSLSGATNGASASAVSLAQPEDAAIAGSLLSKILSTLEVLSLEWRSDSQSSDPSPRQSSGQLSVLGALPGWADQEFECFGSIRQSSQVSIAPEDFSLFLENFVVDAQDFWQAQPSSVLKSGVWTEIGQSGKKLHLEAIALYIEDNQQARHILLVESAALSEEKFQWLQTAREDQLHFISERKIAATKILSATFYDPLTNLPNRKLFLSQVSGFVEDLLEGARAPFALVIFNIDRFKNLNSSLGTTQGDQAIKMVADRIRQCLRTDDVPGRFGGDEFAVILHQPDRTQDLIAIVKRLLHSISKPIVLEGRSITLTASAGVAVCDGRYKRSRDLLRDAGLAMHRAKSLGKGRYALFNHEMRLHSLELWNLETALRSAIANEELQLWYQPIVNASTRHVESFESLLRWEHPDYGWVSPAKFVPLAEESGLITDIDKWVLKTACETIARWNKLGKKVTLNVNISTRHFSEANLFESVRDAIAKTNITPSSLRLEITESSLLSEPKDAIETLNRLKALGVEIAIDDFGTGYASLSYLQDLPLNKLKIDGYFIEMMGTNGSKIVETIIQLSHQLGFGVTAERVETTEQYEMLRQLGCDTVQGYLFSRPVPNAEAQDLVGREMERPQS